MRTRINGVSNLVVLCVYLCLQLESPWQSFYWSRSRFLPHTHSLPEVSAQACLEKIDKKAHLFAFPPCLLLNPDFVFLFCRLCTAAADRKLRLLTSDLQDRHEVKVMQHLEHIGQKLSFGVKLSPRSDVWYLGGVCRRCSHRKQCSLENVNLTVHWWCLLCFPLKFLFSVSLPRWWRATPATLTIWCSSPRRGNKSLPSVTTTLAGPDSVCVCAWFSVLFSVNGAESPDSVSTVKLDAKHNTLRCDRA